MDHQPLAIEVGSETDLWTTEAELDALSQVLELLGPACTSQCRLGNQASEFVRTFARLDAQPRHDTVLAWDEIRALPSFASVDQLLRRSGKCLDVALHEIDFAIDESRKLGNGRLRAKYLDRLKRHRDETIKLVKLFELGEETSNTPFAIRRDVLVFLHGELSEVLAQLTTVRRMYKGRWLPDGFYSEILNVEAELFRLRSRVGKWRDNPSQKLAMSYGKWMSQFTQATMVISKLINNIKYEMQERGCPMGNRLGLIKFYRFD